MSSRQILVVDDQPDILDVVRLAIEVTTEWDVVTCLSLDEAVAGVAGASVDVILLDLSVTDEDAPGAVARLDSASGGVPVLLLTAMSLPASEVERAGATGFIGKPFDPMTLADDIGDLLGWT